MSGQHTLLVLDGLFDDLDVEAEVASAAGWSVARWDGSDAMLRPAEAVVHVRTRIDRPMLDRLPACKVVGRFGTGLDSVDLDAARARGIRVVGVRDYCVPELASHTLALAFALDRRVDAVRAGRLAADASWQEVAAKEPMPGRTAATVVGLGSVGSAVTRALVSLGISVRVVTRRASDDVRCFGAEPATLEDGLATADFVFLHAALAATTTGLIDAARLAQMSRNAILINTARIGLIDENAVAAASRTDDWRGLARREAPPDSPLQAFREDERFLLTPHIGWYAGATT